jgi:hypothetical protein
MRNVTIDDPITGALDFTLIGKYGFTDYLDKNNKEKMM